MDVRLARFLRRLGEACSPEEAWNALRDYRRHAAPLDGPAPLSERETQALEYLARGLRPERIADQMGVARVTVDLHLRNARRKLNAATREQAVAKAIVYGAISPGILAGPHPKAARRKDPQDA